MNHSNPPPFIPSTPLFSQHQMPVMSFASAGDAEFARLNATLGLRLESGQYRKLQYLFYNAEKRNPTFEELRLLGSMGNRAPLFDRLAPGELYTDSEILMETWADIMEGYKSLRGSTVEPCTLSDVLNLPEAYRAQVGAGDLSGSDIRMVTPQSAPKALTEGYRPVGHVSAADGIPRQLWRRNRRKMPTLPSVGDVILALPPAKIEAICAFLDGHPVVSKIHEISAVKETSLLQAALGMCRGWGLSVIMETLIPPCAPHESRIQAYLDTWETDAPDGRAYLLIRLSPLAQAEVFTALSDHGFAPRVLGCITKNPRLVMTYGGAYVVNLKEETVLSAKAARLYRCRLATPAADGNAQDHGGYFSGVTHLSDVGCSVARALVTLTGKDTDGFSPTVDSLLSLVAEYAARGIRYDKLTLLPLLYMKGSEESPLLLSTLCGLYRAAAELGMAVTSPNILFKNCGSAKDEALTLSLTVYTGEAPVAPPVNAETEDERPMHLFHRYNVSSWNDVRGLLFTVSQSAQTAEVSVAPETATEPAREFEITPYPTVTLNQLQDKETKRRKEISAMEKIKAFEPLCKIPRTVLLDTDIGPDCDDVGALAVLIYYAKQYGFPIGGICNCTSNKAGNGVIDAICRRCGIDTPPLGQWHGEDFMDSPEHCKYNVAVAEAHSEAYRNGTLAVDDEVTYYRKRLAAAKDGEVMVISIGMFNNLASLLDSPADDISPLTGMELVKAKVYALVSMAAILPQGRECNVVSDYKSCEKVFNEWPTSIYLSDFHIGVNVKTGYGHITDPETIMADPLPMSYHLYTKAWNWEGAIKGQNASYDLTAVQFAALGICDLYDLDVPGDLEFYAEIPDLPDATRFVANPMGNKIFMTKKVADEVIAESLQKILVSF